MSRREHITYHCERCNKRLRNCGSLNIMTSLSENGCWSRLYVEVTHSHGIHNDGTTEPADLCQKCTIALLEDALTRVKNGERASAGTEDIELSGW